MNLSYNSNQLQELESIYLASRNANDLGPLYKALLKVGKTLLVAYCNSKGIRFSLERKNEIIEDAVTRLLEMYLKYANQKSITLAGRLHLEIKFQLHNPKQIRLNNLVSIPFQTSTLNIDKEETDTKTYIDILNEATDIQGKRIVIDLYRARYYKRAILNINKYTEKKSIYKYAREIDFVWRTLHNKERRN